uniref:Hydroxysteroid dehydrogenase-like protein 2 n=1 Tax=Paramormyrops kingsleyae TaxID=1676925 RepID=A0A3B3R0E7_9TELE
MLPNTGKLAGRTLFITGASRGIGKAIALKAARDGANVVIAAKTAQPHPKLPGTIYTAAEEIQAAGGKALPCVVDIRDENQISNAVEQAVKKFGGIDILINNASAINLTGTVETPMKKVDLMLGINLRGTYLTSKLCIPYLLKSKNPHILNLSPPLNLNPVWFKNHTAYTMAKYGMSMCVLGMAEEFRGSIAVNALWPKTAIQTAAMDMLGGSGISKQCRKVDIIADAAYSILNKPTTYTGNFTIDEDILRAEGISDFDTYAVVPGHPLLPDFFLDSDPEEVKKQMVDEGENRGKLSLIVTVNNQDKSDSDLERIPLRRMVSLNSMNGAQAVGDDAGVWYIDLKNGPGSAGFGEPPNGEADVIMTLDGVDFIKMFKGQLKPTMAFMSGKLKIKGDMTLAIKMEKMMTMMTSKL